MLPININFAQSYIAQNIETEPPVPYEIWSQQLKLNTLKCYVKHLQH